MVEIEECPHCHEGMLVTYINSVVVRQECLTPNCNGEGSHFISLWFAEILKQYTEIGIGWFDINGCSRFGKWAGSPDCEVCGDADRCYAISDTLEEDIGGSSA